MRSGTSISLPTPKQHRRWIRARGRLLFPASDRSSTRHLSAEDIYRSLLESNEDIGLATVYRVLTQFEAASLVTRHHFEDGMAVFELNEGTHHDHIVCLDCGRVEEFTEEGIEARQTAVAKRLGFEIREHSLILYGHCRKSPCPHRKQTT